MIGKDIEAGYAERAKVHVMLFEQELDLLIEAALANKPDRVKEKRAVIVESFELSLANTTNMIGMAVRLANLTPPAPLVIPAELIRED